MANFKKSGAIAAALSIALMGASAAYAATFDFVAMADDTNDTNYIGSREGNWQEFFAGGLTIGNITLNASGSNVDNNGRADAFFDKGTAGLGVCSSLSCSTQDAQDGVLGTDTSDDNVSGKAGGETLTLDFGQVVDITDIFFRNSGHPALTGSLGLNGGILTVENGVVTAGQNLLQKASIFNFKYTNSEFYIASATAVSAVPLPAGMVLLLTGFGALGVARRRKVAAEI